MILVVDASVAIKWFVPEIESAEAELLLDPKFELRAPELAIAEFGNIVSKKWRTGDLEKGQTVTIIDAFRKLGIRYFSNGPLLRSALLGATATNQTVYDWIYLALAVSLSCRFVTADRRFYNAIQHTSDSSRVVWVGDIIRLS